MQRDLLIVASRRHNALDMDWLPLCDHLAVSFELLNLRGRGLLTFLVQGLAPLVSQTWGIMTFAKKGVPME